MPRPRARSAIWFVLRLGSVLDAQLGAGVTQASAGRVVGDALSLMAGIKFGGALVLLAVIVVLTMLTQAFSFEAIRLLEGYWGTRRPVEWVAQWRSDKHSRRRQRIDEQMKELTESAWSSAQRSIVAKQSEDKRLNRQTELRTWSPNMLAFLDAKIRGAETDVELTPEILSRTLAIPWRRYAPPDLLRRLVNLDKAGRDYPRPDRALPTRLGNILRAHEDQTGRIAILYLPIS